MGEHVQLVDLQELRKIIDGLELGDPKRNEYLAARWLKYVQWWDTRAATNKWKYQALRAVVIVGGALLPALVGLRELQGWGDWGWLFSVGTIAVSLMVAVAAGLEEVFHFGEVWREKRKAAEVIKIEGFRYFESAGPYAGRTPADAFPEFAEAVEQIITHEIGEYVAAVMERARSPQSPPAAAVPASAKT